MNEKIDKCILNCITTERGSMPLFRSFGLDVIDQNTRLQRSQIQAQLSEFYPDVTDLEVKQIDQNTYKISVRGDYALE
jgi:hypothetical protein